MQTLKNHGSSLLHLSVYLLGILGTVSCPFEDVEYADAVDLHLSPRRSSLYYVNNNA
jgi:hypothetical protein